ncbi:MAG: glycosyltransferase family protein [Planctomycetota bacterium]|jgi:hypothetical protein
MSVRPVNIAAVLILAVMFLMIIANGLAKPLGRDEQMYCTAGVLLAQGKAIYRDFSYPSQMPYHPLLYAVLFKVLQTRYFLLVGRGTSILCDILVVVCIVGIYRRVFRPFQNWGIWLGLAGAVLYVFNPLVDYASGYAWNHDAVILCVILSLWLFVSCDSARQSEPWRVAAIGALLTLASCMRITTGLVQVLFLCFLLARPASSAKQRLKNTVPFLIGTAMMLVWPVFVIVQAWRPFLLNLVRIPVLYGEWLRKIGMVHNKPKLIVSCLGEPGYLMVIVTAIFVYVLIAWQRRKVTILNGRNVLLTVLLVLMFFVIAFIPPTMWRQYLAMPVPFLIVSLAYPLLYLRSTAGNTAARRHFRIAGALTVVCVIVAVVSYPVVLYRTPVLLVPESWVPVRVHRISEDIFEQSGEGKRVLTLAPLFALEGGCTVYPELSAGSIVYRIADSLSPAERALTHTAGPEALGALVESEPPSAVALGVEMDFLEAPLFESAVRPEEKWEKKDYADGPVVYFRR